MFWALVAFSSQQLDKTQGGERNGEHGAKSRRQQPTYGERVKKQVHMLFCAGQTRSSAYLIIFVYLNLNLQTF